MTTASRVAARWVCARRPTPESRAWQADIKAREKHIKGALNAFKALLKELQPYADQANAAQPGKDKVSLSRRGRVFIKMIKVLPQVENYLNTWIGSEAQNPKAKSWRSQVLYQARNRLCYPNKFPLKKVLVEVGKQADKGFEAIAIAESQAPLREVVPEDIRAFLPKNIVVEVDESGVISKVTDRFENEHLTLAKKIQKMHKLIKHYNKIARQVKKDLKSSDELTQMAALITAIIMETGIRPGKEGNKVVKIQDGKEVEIETFGAITLGPKHVKFVRNNFVTMEFLGKKGGTNVANLSDASIVKILKDYVEKAKKGGSKFIFTTSKGQQFTYTDLQRYFREQLGDFSPTDFRKLKATETVLDNLREAQAELYARIKGFSKKQGDDLAERVAQEIAATLDAAYHKAQEALSHEDVATTIRSYVNPEIILRFLSQGGVADTLEKAILGGKTKLLFDPQTFVQKALGKTASLQDILDDLEDEDVAVRVAARWIGATSQRTSGRLEAPPLMVEEISKWALSVAATKIMADIDKSMEYNRQLDIEKKKEGQKIKKAFTAFRKALRAKTKPKALWEMYAGQKGKNSIVHLVTSQFAWTAVGVPGRPGIKSRDFYKLYREGKLAATMDRMFKGIEERVNAQQMWGAGENERLEKEKAHLKKFQVSEYKKATPGNVEREFEVAPLLKGWKYEGILADQGRIKKYLAGAEKRLKMREQWNKDDEKKIKALKARGEKLDPGLAKLRKIEIQELKDLRAEVKALKAGKPITPFQKVRVILTTDEIPGALATWADIIRTMKITLPNSIYDWSRNQLRRIVRHESQHFAQSFLSDAVGGKAGLPPKKLRTPQYQQWMNPRSQGFREDDPKLQHALRELREQGFGDRDFGHGRVVKQNPKDFDFHAMDDIEFYTRLDDAVDEFKGQISELKTKAQKNKAIDFFTGVAAKSDKDKTLYRGIMDNTRFFYELKRIPTTRAKWVKAVKEFRKALGYTGKRKIK